jgi:hypothetical protein
MKTVFYAGLLGLIAFEVMNVYLIMPMPGSQQMNSINLAYFLHQWRWAFRAVLGLVLLTGLFGAGWKRRRWLLLPLGILATVIYFANFEMAADHMFYQPSQLSMVDAAMNKVDTGRLVIGVVNNGQAKAYPIRFLGYHHQVRDSVGGKPVIVSYCTVCRTGRVFEPVVNGRQESFRLVGMDHFNAMFEDARTGSWWRQVTGEAIAGKLKGSKLPELFSTQGSLAEWLKQNPRSLIMQADSAFISSYDTTLKYESGESRSKLTGTDSLSWKEKSWVVGVKAGSLKKAYDWNRLKEDRMIEDKLGSCPILLVLATDNKNFFAFEKPDDTGVYALKGDTILFNGHHYHISGAGIDTGFALRRLPAYQEFWHSWRTFNPGTAF